MSNTISVSNTRGSVIATIAPGTFDTSSPVSLAGRGSNGFALSNNTNFYRLTENFASSTAPSTPVEGMLWYDTSIGMKYRNTSAWVSLATGSNTDILLTRLVTASNINMNTAASHNIHTGASGVKTLITSLLVVPRTGASVSGAPPAVALEVSNNTGDIADRLVLKGLTSDATHYRTHIGGAQRIVTGGDTVKLNIKTAIQGGDTLSVDIYLFGITL